MDIKKIFKGISDDYPAQRTEKREKRIQEIRDCGQAIIDNAERIYSDYKYPQGLKIIIELDTNAAPTIQVVKNFLPDPMIERYEI